MDPLSDVLTLLKPRSQFYASLDAAGDWSFSFPANPGIKFTAVVRGSCWGIVDDLAEPVRFNPGDCFLLNSGRRFVLASDPALPPADCQPVMDAAARDGVAVWNGGGEVLLISGRFDVSASHAAPLFDTLPAIVNVPSATGHAEVLRWSLEQLAEEVRQERPGSALMATHLVHCMLVQVLRLHLETSTSLSPGWFLALSDRQIGAAIRAIHADPAHPWTLAELAKIAGMSRSGFAQRFKELEGGTAIGYVTRWRMLTAANLLRDGEQSVSSIAFSLGYESESAFSTAFKRTMSCSPLQYRRQSTPSEERRDVAGALSARSYDT
ncbi:AraC family transcriptional regulator [Burkholderia lata]|uniref:AraC family transcriptional regulator n=2 Tax=Burkholderia lata (strain ATCC 17760 / DSM 23089 / LMG 22485 / NCIMB 9086 / R18194 / 383) TaxID=482957 RepID=A0A6P3CQZ7_BURL3|nr:AraC family transcriptional regulator [Burkholderia lata]VWB19588.1 AraC family transcriptional regulator [Burkholderia lata]VWM19268.1 AraC family transcriptional regulator [Burkholderia lata]